MVSQITNLTIVYSTVNSGRDQESIKAPRHWPLWGENTPVVGEFPAQRASNAENVSIWWRHHAIYHPKDEYVCKLIIADTNVYLRRI